jgi:hypothetical protein
MLSPAPSSSTRAGTGTASPGRSRRRRAVAALLLAVTVVGLLGGCARVRTALAVQPDDTVTGEIIIATPPRNADDKGPQITVPADLQSEIDVSEYDQDNYVGSVLRFSGLTFDQVAQLPQVGGAAGERMTISMRRAGNRVVVDATADLTTVPVDRADFQLKISFPGEVLDTNGENDSGTVSWSFTPGEVGDANAIVAYDDPGAPSVAGWTFGLTLLVAAAVAAVAVLAHRTRNPPVRP